MSNLLQLQNGAKGYGGRTLFSGASFAINASEHVGVIGPNGAGKTTLFRILTGEESLDQGQLVQTRGLRVGYLAQHDLWAPGTMVEDFLSQDTLTPLWELKSLARGLGLREEHFPQPLESLSGGYRMRVKLLQLLGQEPDLLLLDEPTNYLDLESLIVLENFLQSAKGAFLLISHDREFLRRTTDHILEVEGGEVVKYNGGLDDYFEQKELLRSQLEARAMSQEEKRRSVMEFVNRFGAKATKARQAQSRLKSLEKMEVIQVKALPNVARIQIPTPRPCGKEVLALKDLTLGYPGKAVLQGVSLSLARGEHLAVVGVNGAGKSTLLKTLSGQLAALQGSVHLGHEVRLGYYAQHVAEHLRPGDTVLEAMAAKMHPDVSGQQIKNLAGSLLFSGDDAHKRVSVLSGGEKARVALGQILLQKAPLLILDEPTNHLDFQTVEALTEALTDFEGSLVVVSHDRSFIRRVGTKILELRDGRAELYLGTYDEYVWSVQQGALSQRTESSQAPATKAQNRPPATSQRKTWEHELKQVQKEILKIEKRLEASQEELRILNERSSLEAGSHSLQEILKDLVRSQSEVESLEESWLNLDARREVLQKQISGDSL